MATRPPAFGSGWRGPGSDPDGIEAVTREGVLEVTVALPEQEVAARKVITPKPA